MNVLSKKPCETPESKFLTVDTLLCGEAAVNWKECMRECANRLVNSSNANIQGHVVPTGCNEQSFKATLKTNMKSYWPACAGTCAVVSIKRRSLALSMPQCLGNPVRYPWSRTSSGCVANW